MCPDPLEIILLSSFTHTLKNMALIGLNSTGSLVQYSVLPTFQCLLCLSTWCDPQLVFLFPGGISETLRVRALWPSGNSEQLCHFFCVLESLSPSGLLVVGAGQGEVQVLQQAQA